MRIKNQLRHPVKPKLRQIFPEINTLISYVFIARYIYVNILRERKLLTLNFLKLVSSLSSSTVYFLTFLYFMNFVIIFSVISYGELRFGRKIYSRRFSVGWPIITIDRFYVRYYLGYQRYKLRASTQAHKDNPEYTLFRLTVRGVIDSSVSPSHNMHTPPHTTARAHATYTRTIRYYNFTILYLKTPSGIYITFHLY